MPIYAYGCSSCGLQKDVMQRMSDAPLSVCPECGKETFTKQLTAAGFQLKGSGYYVTDFKNGSKKPALGGGAEVKSNSKPDSKSDGQPAVTAAPAPTASSAPSPTTSGAA